MSKVYEKGFNLSSLAGQPCVCVLSSFVLEFKIKLLVWRQKLRGERLYGPHITFSNDYSCCHYKNQRSKHTKHLNSEQTGHYIVKFQSLNRNVYCIWADLINIRWLRLFCNLFLEFWFFLSKFLNLMNNRGKGTIHQTTPWGLGFHLTLHMYT